MGNQIQKEHEIEAEGAFRFLKGSGLRPLGVRIQGLGVQGLELLNP